MIQYIANHSYAGWVNNHDMKSSFCIMPYKNKLGMMINWQRPKSTETKPDKVHCEPTARMKSAINHSEFSCSLILDKFSLDSPACKPCNGKENPDIMYFSFHMDCSRSCQVYTHHFMNVWHWSEAGFNHVGACNAVSCDLKPFFRGKAEVMTHIWDP